MNSLIENSLFCLDKKRYRSIKTKAGEMNIEYIGDNIVQDDIFRAIENYCKMHDQDIEIIRFPINDEEICACTFLRDATLFVYVNSGLSLAKQIFAAGHELYHIYCYLEENVYDYRKEGSILKNSVIDREAIEKEDKEANAFSGLILAPESVIENQIKINQIDVKNIGIRDVLQLMEIFGIPYKAMVIRLMETGIIDLNKAEEMIDADYLKLQKITGLAKRWLNVPSETETLGTLEENMYICEHGESVSQNRISNDKVWLKEIKVKSGWNQ